MFDCLLPVLVWWLHPPPLHWDGDFNWIREHTDSLRTAGLCLISVLEIYALGLRHFSLSCACWNNWKSKQSSSGSTGSSGVEGSLPSDRLNNVCLLIFYPNWEPGWHTSVVRANTSQPGRRGAEHGACAARDHPECGRSSARTSARTRLWLAADHRAGLWLVQRAGAGPGRPLTARPHTEAGLWTRKLAGKWRELGCFGSHGW